MNTKKENVLMHMIKNHSISGLEALSQYGLYRLSSAIHRLREEYMIHTDIVQVNDVRFARYRLVKYFSVRDIPEGTRFRTAVDHYSQPKIHPEFYHKKNGKVYNSTGSPVTFHFNFVAIQLS